jgi:hypothetical protein
MGEKETEAARERSGDDDQPWQSGNLRERHLESETESREAAAVKNEGLK